MAAPSAELTTELSDDPEARAAQIAGLKKEYDWIYTNKFEFGRILNENRYELPDLDDPELVFLPVNPATGAPLYRTPITYEPGRVDEFGLVANALTEVEVGLARFSDPLQPGEFESALQFADSCLLKRNETPRALEVAETLYQRAQQINLQDDARPRMGLAPATSSASASRMPTTPIVRCSKRSTPTLRSTPASVSCSASCA